MPKFESILDQAVEKEFSLEQVDNAVLALRDFLELKPEERVGLLKDADSNKKTFAILKEALDKIGCSYQELLVDDETKANDLEEITKNSDLLISVSMHDTTDEIYEDEYFKKYKYRLLALLDADSDVFNNGGAMTEKREDLEHRLNKMENTLDKARGFKITSSYGTNLEVGLRRFAERRWYKDSGVINAPGKWDNLPGGEIFTTPDERTVNGILVLPALDSGIAPDQGVDELVRIHIKEGVITAIEGGQSAEKLRKCLEKDMRLEKKEKENPFDVLRIAEISFGANTKARSKVADPEQSYKALGISTIEAEKRFGTMHLAFGSSAHGEAGTEGFEDAGSHYDFVIPRNGLTVEMFTDEKDFDRKKNGRKIIEEGTIKFFD
ncbi:aminopeptidase [Patescibacteria group bacterium]|nr:aminopeptidase [Patescibacteria group bacterium]